MTEAGWQALFGEISSDFLFFIKFMILTMGSVLSTNQVMMLNSLRCMFTSGFENGWYVLGAIYYFSLQFGFSSLITMAVSNYYPYVCTCTNDANNFSQLLGASSYQTTIMSYCSEAASNAVSTSSWFIYFRVLSYFIR